uniref:Uncharacterized protein n=1 Tax=Amphimedon queenslandica TaxID=400682 RepID=A0A1X7V3U8_AMPQE
MKKDYLEALRQKRTAQDEGHVTELPPKKRGITGALVENDNLEDDPIESIHSDKELDNEDDTQDDEPETVVLDDDDGIEIVVEDEEAEIVIL